MHNPDKNFDLHPSEWKSAENAHEPILGPNGHHVKPFFIYLAVGLVVGPIMKVIVGWLFGH